jgi:hypothetical protein
MHAHISYTADTGEKLVNETFGPNNIRRRGSGRPSFISSIFQTEGTKSCRWSATASSWSSTAPR